ncbi:MAG TPA: serine hydrolase domain-containing protein [Steroidobacteraceae bacterium]|nr:serine hydrolase domain-containing protein [Steroidobacteraceae bacterium]
MSSSGFSPPRLARLRQAMAAHLESGELPGIATLVGRGEERHVETLGVKAFGGGDAMRRDTIFRIASMTKPITAVAALILVEECKLRLDEPVDRLLPELANRRVLKRIDGPLEDTVPARRPITLRDLLTFRMGFGMTIGPPNATPIQKALTEAGIMGLRPSPPYSPDEWIRRLGTLPLMHQPGERWQYHTGSDVLGVLIARASGQPFDRFLAQRIFEPLGMKDTAFHVPAHKLERLASCYQSNPESGAVELLDEPRETTWARPPSFPAGGGGLVSTLDDYYAFGRMLLQGGRCGSERILARPTVEAMTSDQLTSQQRAEAHWFTPDYFDSHGWGFGVATVIKRFSTAASVGQFGWGGAFGTTWFCDPREDLVAVLMIQRMALAPSPADIRQDFAVSVYQAIDD